MALMDTRMPLLAQAPSPVEAFSRGASAADIYNRQQQGKRKRNFLEQYGKDLFAGNTNALREYATHDLQGAMALKGHFDAKRRAAAAGSRAESKKKVQAGLDAMSVVYDEAADIEDESARAEYFQGRALEIVGQETVEQLGLTYDNFVPMATRLAGEVGLTYSAPEPVEGKAVGGQLLDPYTGEVIGPGAGPEVDPDIAEFDQAWSRGGGVIGSAEYEEGIRQRFLNPEQDSSVSSMMQGYNAHVAQAEAAGETPLGVVEYQQAIKGQGVSVTADGVSVQVGGGTVAPDKSSKIESGMQQIASVDQNGNPIIRWVPIQGSARHTEETEKIQKQGNALQSFVVKNDLVIEDIDRALDAINPLTSGKAGVGASNPLHPGHDLYNLLTTVKANLGFDKLQDMRDNSPTGGALGQVSTFELEQLQAVFGSLSQTQSPDQLRHNLSRLRDLSKGQAERLQKAYERDKTDYGILTGGSSRLPTVEEIEAMSQEQAARIPANVIGQITDPDVLDAIIKALGGQ